MVAWFGSTPASLAGTKCQLATVAARTHIGRVIRISISPAAFDAIASTMPLGTVGFDAEANERGERMIWLPLDVLAKLKALRGPGDSYSDAIITLAEATAGR